MAAGRDGITDPEELGRSTFGDVSNPEQLVEAQHTSTGSRALPDAVLVTAIYLASRLVVLATAKATTWLFPNLSVTAALSGWDGGWYLAIAANGYPDSLANEGAGVRWAFFPAWPAIIRAFSDVTGLSLPVAGIVLANVLGLAAVGAIWLLVRDVLGRETATTTATLVCFFPSAYVFSMVYTESLFFLVAALGIRATVRMNWLTAGLCASIAGLIRPPGLVIVIVVIVAGTREVLRHRPSWRLLVGVLLAPTGFVMWAAYQWIRLGDPLAYLEAQRIGWYNEFSWFTTPFRSFWEVVTDRKYWSRAPEVMAGGTLVLVIACASIAARFARRNPRLIPIEWWLYSGLTILFAFSAFWPIGIPRYSMAAIPLYAVVVAELPKRAVPPVLCVSAGLMACFSAVAIGGLVSGTAPFAP